MRPSAPLQASLLLATSLLLLALAAAHSADDFIALDSILSEESEERWQLSERLLLEPAASAVAANGTSDVVTVDGAPLLHLSRGDRPLCC
jgi:hypothetical protein